MNTEKQPCTNLASLIATHPALLGHRRNTLLDHYSLPIGWYVTVNKLLSDHRRLLNVDGNSPNLSVAVINAHRGSLVFAVQPHWEDRLSLETPLLNNARSRPDLDPDEAEQIEQLFANAPETLTRMHLRYASSRLVDKAKEAVAHICEECGAPGEQQRDLWKPRALCPHHYVIALSQQGKSGEEEKETDWGSRESYPDDDDDLVEFGGRQLPVQLEGREADKASGG
jgi:hypothetical protein